MKKIFTYLRGARRYMFAAILLNLLFAGMNVWYTDIFRRYFNRVQGGNTSDLTTFVIYLISLELLMTVSHYVSSLCSGLCSRYTLRHIQEKLYEHFLHAMSEDIDRQSVGGLSSLISNDAGVAASGISSGAIRFFHLVTRFFIYTVYLFLLNWQMALITLLIGPLMLLLGKIFSGRIEKRANTLREAEAACSEVMLSGLNVLTFVKINRLSGFLKHRYHDAWDKREKCSLNSDRVSILYDELTSFLGVVGSVLILGVAAVMLANGHLAVGTVVAYLQLHNEIVWPFIEMSSLWRQLLESKVSIARVEEALKIPAENPLAKTTHETVSHIEARGVVFGYHNESHVLRHVDFHARKGEIVCLLGENGAGKSTLLKLLCGLYLPKEGEVFLDDVCLTADTMQEIRSAYSFVMQHEHVFDGSIRENLTFGENIPQRDIDICAQKTGLAAYVNGLSDGYDTYLTNQSLSGGELKKLSLTRMLLADKPVIVLDEPFAHLDEEGVERLLYILEELRKDKIIILVTHNPELVRYTDRVVRIDAGTVV